MQLLRRDGKKVARAGRTTNDAQIVTTRVPTWLAFLVVALAVVVLGLAGTLIRAKTGTTRSASESYAAIDKLEADLKESPDNPQILVELGFEYRKAGMYDDALRVNRRVGELDPNDVASRYHVGAILAEMGETDQAEAALWDVLQIDPQHAMAAKALGELYAEQGQYKSMIVAVEPAALASPQLADLQYLLGLGREKTGDEAGAGRAYGLALERDPNLAEARAGLNRVRANTQ